MWQTIFLMHLHDLEGVLAVAQRVVIKFVPERRRGQLGPWELGQRRKPQSVHHQADGVHKAC